MSSIRIGENVYESGNGSVLDCLQQNGESIPSSCRSGLCHACEMVALEGEIPKKAQQGLATNKIQARHFLACQCIPESDMVVSLPDGFNKKSKAIVVKKQRVNPTIILLTLRVEDHFTYIAGQYIRLYKEENDFRCYSIASNPSSDDGIELHIQLVPNGVVSGWINHQLEEGDAVYISDALGTCIYADDNIQPIIFVASNSGLAPIYGMLKRALSLNHKQEIRLYHGVSTSSDKYLVNELLALQEINKNLTVEWFDYSQNDTQHFIDKVLSNLDVHFDWRIYFCGSPNMVSYGKKQSFLKGIPLRNLFSDSFAPAKING